MVDAAGENGVKNAECLARDDSGDPVARQVVNGKARHVAERDQRVKQEVAQEVAVDLKLNVRVIAERGGKDQQRIAKHVYGGKEIQHPKEGGTNAAGKHAAEQQKEVVIAVRGVDIQLVYGARIVRCRANGVGGDGYQRQKRQRYAVRLVSKATLDEGVKDKLYGNVQYQYAADVQRQRFDLLAVLGSQQRGKLHGAWALLF